MKNLISYEKIELGLLERHPVHIKMFPDVQPTDSRLEWLRRSYEQFGKLKYIFAIQQSIDGVIHYYVIDGWKSKIILQQMGEKDVTIAVLNITDEKDIAQVMAELQKSHHSSLMEEFGIYETLYSIFSKGRGYRADLEELTDSDAEEEGIAEDEKKKRRDTVYDVIGKMCGVSKNRVMYMIKVGRVNPWHFEKIEKERYALYAAYLDCKDEEEGAEPEVPQPKEPVYHSDSTESPVYTEPSSADDAVQDYTSDNTEQAETSYESDEEDIVTITTRVPRKALAGTDINAAPKVEVDDSDATQVVITLTFPKF